MELSIQQGDLAYAVGKAFGSVSAKSPMPLLSCLLLEADKGGLRVTGSDLDVTTAVTVPCAVKAVGKAAVAARHFNEVVRKMPRGMLQLGIAGEQCEVRYGEGKGWSRFPVQDATDFPRIPELKAENQVTLEGDALSRLIARTAYAASTDATRPNLSGVFVQGADKQVTLVATDGHRLARAARKGAYGGLGKDGVIVPSRALAAVLRTAEEATSPVAIEISEGRNQAGFTAQVGEFRVQILARLLQGPYPNYEQVIPKNNPRDLTVRRDELLEAVDIVASHADNVTRQVRFSLSDGSLGVSSATELGAGEHRLQRQLPDRHPPEHGERAGRLPAQQCSGRRGGGAGRRPEAGRRGPAVPGHAAAASRRGGLIVQSIAGLLPVLLRDLGLEAGLMGWRAVREWPDAVGPALARRTRAVSFQEGTLLVEVEGSAWLHELSMLRRDLVRQLNAHLGSPTVRELRLVNARGGIRR